MLTRKWCKYVIIISVTLVVCYILGLWSGLMKLQLREDISVGTENEGSTVAFAKVSDLYLKAPTKVLQPNSSDRIHMEQMIRDSIDEIHSKNLIKPVNESCKRRLPSCIVIGVSKCGTRELIDFMHLHPHIQSYRAKVYEMNYFSERIMRGLEWLKQKMPCSYSNQITVMKNAGYFHSGFVAERIKQFNESIKLILMVREPIWRLVSHLTFNKRIEQAQLPNLEYNNLFRIYANLIKKSVYNESMALWLKYFSLSQILVIESNELKYDPVSVLRRVEEFLGLGHFINPEMFVFNKEKGFFCIRSNLTSTGMACYSGNRGRDTVALPQETVLKLTEYFKPRNKKFFDLIGRSFKW